VGLRTAQRVRSGPVLRGNGGRGQASPLQGKLAWLAEGRMRTVQRVRSGPVLRGNGGRGQASPLQKTWGFVGQRRYWWVLRRKGVGSV